MKCPDCGVETSRESMFCHKCGARLDRDAPQADQDPTATHTTASEPTVMSRKFVAAGREQRPQADEPRKGVPRVSRNDPEEEVWTGGYSGRAMVNVWAACAILTLAYVATAIYMNSGMGWLIALGLTAITWVLALITLAYRRLNISYRLTTQRFFHEHGILRRVIDRIEVIDMDDITFEQRVLERIMNVGSIRITSSDRTHPELWLRGIFDVRNVAGKIDDVRRKERLRRGMFIESV